MANMLSHSHADLMKSSTVNFIFLSILYSFHSQLLILYWVILVHFKDCFLSHKWNIDKDMSPPFTWYITTPLHKDRTPTITARYFPLPYAIFCSFPLSLACRTWRIKPFDWSVKGNKSSHWTRAQKTRSTPPIIGRSLSQFSSLSRHTVKTNERIHWSCVISYW